MKFDLHTHHIRCGHAVDNICDYIEAAVRAGLTVIGIADHAPFWGRELDHPLTHLAMAKSEFPNYITEIINLKNEYSNRIEVLVGVESDFFPEHTSIYRRELARYPLDYAIGSLHVSNNIHLLDRAKAWERMDRAQRIREKEIYYRLMQRAAQSGLFDILGHFDVLKKTLPEFTALPTDIVEDTLKVVAENDLTMEINTSGRLGPTQTWFPDDEILERAKFYDIKVTFGSDAHKPERIGEDFEAVRQRLKGIGFKEWAIFRQRKRVMIPL